MIDYNNVLDLLKNRIPEFEFDETFADIPIVASNFFTVFINESYKKSHEDIINKCAAFVNELAETDDFNVRGMLDEIAIGLYDESKNIYNDFRNRLTNVAKEKFHETITKWNNQ